MICLIHSFLNAEWASLYRQKISKEQAVEADRLNAFIFKKQNIPLFSQLLCSWNAIRPAKGHLTFFGRARNAHTQKWGSWHRMMEWGIDIQRSHATRSDGFTQYMHVRLETEPLQLADAFCIKVVGAKGASLKTMKGLAVTVMNMNNFKPESVAKASFNAMESITIKNVPKISQIALNHDESHRICSPVSCTMVMQYLTGIPIDPALFAKLSYDKGLKIYGSWPFNMAHAFEYTKGKNWFYNTRLNSFSQIHSQLKRGFPVIVSVRGTLPGAPQSFAQGHLLVVTGWDNNTGEVICHDPSADKHHQVEHRYTIDNFITAWERSRRLTYWVEPA